jgi:hypothetical protein
MRSRLFFMALGLLSPGCMAAEVQLASGPLQRVPFSQLLTTEGAVTQAPQERWRVEVPKLRAVVPSSTSSVAELRFTYLGPTKSQPALASGERRQQVGLKLRALDGCNVAYVMWRLAPKPGLVVSVKSNPKHHTSDDCGNRGYTTVDPRENASVPLIEPGDTHVLRAELDGLSLHVLVDGALVWSGELPSKAVASKGPVGLRTDNGRFELELFTQLP